MTAPKRASLCDNSPDDCGRSRKLRCFGRHRADRHPAVAVLAPRVRDRRAVRRGLGRSVRLGGAVADTPDRLDGRRARALERARLPRPVLAAGACGTARSRCISSSTSRRSRRCIYFTGGYTNPFVSLYLLPISLAAASLPRAYAWSIGALCGVCYSLVWRWHVPLPPVNARFGSDFDLHVAGMWVNFLIAAALIVFFVGRMARLVRRRDQELAALREAALRDQQIVELGTLAAGTAHELNTPLSTLAILVEELNESATTPAQREHLNVMAGADPVDQRAAESDREQRRRRAQRGRAPDRAARVSRGARRAMARRASRDRSRRDLRSARSRHADRRRGDDRPGDPQRARQRGARDARERARQRRGARAAAAARGSISPSATRALDSIRRCARVGLKSRLHERARARHRPAAVARGARAVRRSARAREPAGGRRRSADPSPARRADRRCALNAARSVLVVDDDVRFAETLARALERAAGPRASRTRSTAALAAARARALGRGDRRLCGSATRTGSR